VGSSQDESTSPAPEIAAKSHWEEFASYADALRYLEGNFDEPLTGRGS
jgi:hypothetical protein